MLTRQQLFHEHNERLLLLETLGLANLYHVFEDVGS